jgi:Protein of unknown function (DUF2721)
VQDLSRLTETGHAIQLAVAPVFLLSGVSAMLVVLTNRLARIIDRGRLVEAGLPPCRRRLRRCGTSWRCWPGGPA